MSKVQCFASSSKWNPIWMLVSSFYHLKLFFCATSTFCSILNMYRPDLITDIKHTVSSIVHELSFQSTTLSPTFLPPKHFSLPILHLMHSVGLRSRLILILFDFFSAFHRQNHYHSFLFAFFFNYLLYCPIGISPMGNSGCFFSPGKASCNRVALPNLQRVLGVLVFP